jgi:ABC-type multidrug transport system ATPase subunit
MTVQADIEARAVSYQSRVGDVTVRDISMTIGQGELVAIMGARGSGKTTLLDALSGLLSPSSGTVLRPSRGDGRPAAGCTGAVERRIGYVPDGDTMHPVLPLGRALRYSAELRGITLPENNGDDGLAEVLRAANLAGMARIPVGDLNPGERKRAAVAAELLAGPAQLFLDEPTANLDPAQATEVLRLLRRLSGRGVTVVLTTSSPLDAGRCDKVAVLATGGHLAFFGSPTAACGYFGADSLEEVYERLAGLGDPARAWSRRYFQFPQPRTGSAPVPTTPRAPGPAVLVPDEAGPHSAGRPGLFIPGGIAAWDETGTADGADDEEGEDEPSLAVPVAAASSADNWADNHGADHHGADHHGAGNRGPGRRGPGPLQPVRLLSVLVRRNAEVLARARRTQLTLAIAPVAVLLAFCLLLGSGALDGSAAVTLAWAVLGGLAAGLAYELPQARVESGVLRGESFPGHRTVVFLLAKAAVLLPVLAIADAVILAVPAIDGRLRAGFGPAFLAVLIASAVGLAAALAVPVLSARR